MSTGIPPSHSNLDASRQPTSDSTSPESNAVCVSFHGQDRRQSPGSSAAPDFAIVGTDLAGIINVWSEGARRVFGWSDAQAYGRHIELIFTPDDLASGRPRHEMEQALYSGH